MPEYLENPRRVPRDPVRCRASIALVSGAVETSTEDIGSRGCQVILPAALQRGAQVALTIQAPRLAAPLRIDGRVVWVSSQPPWRVGIAYAAGGLNEAARWMESFRQAAPELFVRERRPVERVAVDAMIFLGVAPKVADFTEAELTVLKTIGSGLRVGELRATLSHGWPRMQRSLFSLLSQGYVTLSRAASGHPVTWKEILGAPPAPPAPGVALVGDELVLESLLERNAAVEVESIPLPTPLPLVPAPQARRAVPATPAPPPTQPRRAAPATPAPPPAQPRRAAPATPGPPPLPAPRRTAPAPAPAVAAVPPPLPTATPSPRATRPAMEAVRPGTGPVHDFVGAGVGWRGGASAPRSPEADALFQLALLELQGKHELQALSLLRRALALAPGDPEIASAIGRAMKGG